MAKQGNQRGHYGWGPCGRQAGSPAFPPANAMPFGAQPAASASGPGLSGATVPCAFPRTSVISPRSSREGHLEGSQCPRGQKHHQPLQQSCGSSAHWSGHETGSERLHGRTGLVSGLSGCKSVGLPRPPFTAPAVPWAPPATPAVASSPPMGTQQLAWESAWLHPNAGA